MGKFKYSILTLGIILGGLSLTVIPSTAVGASAISEACKVDPNSALCTDKGDIMGFVSTLVKTLLFILGAVSVVMIIFAGFRYVTSGGDAKAVEGAKNTIMYAVIGLVVALLAYAIVSFVVGKL
jgi:hypothetical protein